MATPASTRVHINGSGKLAPCDATQRRCKYQHFETVEQGMKHVMSLIENGFAGRDKTHPERLNGEDTAPAGRRLPVEYPKSLFRPPTAVSGYHAEYDWDYYGAPDGEELEDYNRNAIYRGLSITSVDAEEAVKSSVYDYKHQSKDLPEELKIMIQDEGWDDEGNWDIYGDRGYYGEEIQIDPPEGMQERLTDWFYSLPNAEDDDKILPYVRADGTETAGLRPVDAVKKMIGETHPRFNRKMEKTDSVQVKKVPMDKITTTTKRLNEAADWNYPEGVKLRNYAGVLLQVNKDEFLLLDGARRLNYLRENHPTRKPSYLVLYKKANQPARPGGYRKGSGA